jgi:hypothetical protein
MKRLHALLCSLTLALSLVLSVLALGSPAAAQAGEATNPAASLVGTDCGCPKVGTYVLPKAPVDPYIDGFGASARTDPDYHVEATGTFPFIHLQVRRSAGDALVLDLSGVPGNWGFSPDQRTFVTYGVMAEQYVVQLYDLTGANPSRAIFEATTRGAQPDVGFSPHGRYLLHYWLSPTSQNEAHLQFADTRTGSKVSTSYSFASPPGDKAGSSTWGFSPDQGDHAFFVRYATSQTDEYEQAWDLTNGKTQSTFHLPRHGTGFTAFSPCGDLVGWVEQGSSGETIRLHRVSDGGTVTGKTFTQVAAVELRATAESHLANVGGVDHVLAPNTSGKACPDAEAPHWTGSPVLQVADVQRTSVTLTWPAAADNVAVTSYRVFQDGKQVFQLSGRSYQASGLSPDTTYTFQVRAGDAAGNWSETGPTTTVTTVGGAPTWPTGSTLTAVEGATPGTVHLTWTAATHPVKVTGYQVYVDGELAKTTPGTALGTDLTGFERGRTYTFTVEAGEAGDTWSTTGPVATLHTSALQRVDTATLGGRLLVDGGIPRQLGMNAYQVVDGTVARGPISTNLDRTTGEWRMDNLADGEYLVAVQFSDLRSVYPADWQPWRLTVEDGRGWTGADFVFTDGKIPPLDGGTGTVSGTLYDDPDLDGVADGPLAGVPMMCEHCSSTSVVTDENGHWSITGLWPGLYEITPFWPENYVTTSPRVGDDTWLHRVVVIGPDGGSFGGLDYTLGELTGKISGSIYEDVDGDGTKDEGEGSLFEAYSVRVCLDDADEGADDYEQCVATNGSFSFEHLAPGAYELWIGDGQEWSQTEPAAGTRRQVVVEANGDHVHAAPLGVHRASGVVTGVVWDDADHDKVRDPGEQPVPNALVCVRTGEQPPFCRSTDDEGHYRTVSLPPGSYRAWLELPEDTPWVRTLPPSVNGHSVVVGDGDVVEADFGVALPWTDPPPATDPTTDPATDPTPGDGPAAVAPAAPRKLRVGEASKPRTLKLRWLAPVSDGGRPVVDYVIEWSTRKNRGWVAVEDAVSSARRATVALPRKGRKVFFRVAAVTEVGVGTWSAPVRWRGSQAVRVR